MRPNPQETAFWSHLLEKSLMENFIFCAVTVEFFLVYSISQVFEENN